MVRESCAPPPEVIHRIPGRTVRSQFNERRMQYFSKYRAPNYSCEDRSIPYHPKSVARSHGSVETANYVGPRLTDEYKLAEMDRLFRVFQAEREYLFDRSGWHHPLLYMSSSTAPPISDIHRLKPEYPKDNYPLPIFYAPSSNR